MADLLVSNEPSRTVHTASWLQFNNTLMMLQNELQFLRYDSLKQQQEVNAPVQASKETGGATITAAEQQAQCKQVSWGSTSITSLDKDGSKAEPALVSMCAVQNTSGTANHTSLQQMQQPQSKQVSWSSSSKASSNSNNSKPGTAMVHVFPAAGATDATSTATLQQTQQQLCKQMSRSNGDNFTCSSDSSKPTMAQTSSATFTSSSSLLANSAGAAAVAAYRRQYLGLDAGPVPGAAAIQQNVQNSKSGFMLKSRPNGLSPPDYGPQHTPGYLLRPIDAAEQSAVPNLPAKSGTGMVLPPAMLMPGSCCPPPCPEPLVTMDPAARTIIAEQQAQRILEPGMLMNRIVYDSLEPPDPAGTAFPEQWYDSSTASSSCRTTGSGYTTRSSSTIGHADDTPAGATLAGANPSPATHECGVGADPTSWYTPSGPDDPTLVFESRFECGNLRRAVQVYPFEYDLVLQPDINTRSHTQWYYFSVSNTRAGQAYRFNIINLMKPDSLYNMGMLPLMHSEQQMMRKGIGWTRSGYDVCYGPNSVRRGRHQHYYTLTFVMEFPHSDDLVHLAHCYPYSYTDLQNYLYIICKEPGSSILLQRSCMATSLGGNAVDVLTITAPESCGKPISQRQGVVLSARVHPGETNASWMMKGALQQLLSSCAESCRLREQFVFKAVPMLNPDGVIVGNYRCSLAGLDLNRVWQEPDVRIQPVITGFKDMIKAFTEEREVVLFVDMHGHSRKYGIFCYGCEKKGVKDTVPQAPGWPIPGSIGTLPGVPAKNLERLFPLMLNINAPDLFSYRSCNFKVQKSKAGTGRVVGFRELGLMHAYTIEASFCGPSVGKYAKQHFSTGHLEDMGSALVRTLLDYWAPPEQSSAAELSAQLVAAGNGSGAAAAAQSALGILIDPSTGADDDDVCTDSDDESSSEEDEKPAAATSAAAAQALSKRTSRRVTETAAAEAEDGAAAEHAAAMAVASISNNVTQLSNQLLTLLSGSAAATAGDVSCSSSSSVSAPALTSEAQSGQDSVIAALLSALQSASRSSSETGYSSQTASATPTAGRRTIRRSSSKKSSSLNASSSSNSTVASDSRSSNNSSTNSSQQANQFASTVAAAKAAQRLLTKLKSAKPMFQVTAAASADLNASGVTCHAELASSLNTAAGAAVGTPRQWVPAAANGGSTSDTRQPGASCIAASSSVQNSSLCVGAALMVSNGADVAVMQQQCGTTVQSSHAELASVQLTPEEHALANIPGFVDLLQQLVDEHTALTALTGMETTAGCGGAAKGGKKKGRRRGLARYGNPEVLRAARAKSDASLAAALPELGTLLGDEEAEAADGKDDNSGISTAFTNSGAPVAAHAVGESSNSWLGFMRPGRRANTASSKTNSKGCALDAERYIDLLDKQKRFAGGVLASSSLDDPWTYSSPPSSVSSSTRTTCSAHSTSNVKVQQGPAAPSSAAAVAAAGAAGCSSNSALIGAGTAAKAVATASAASKGSCLWAACDIQPTAFAEVVAAAQPVAHGSRGPAGAESPTGSCAISGRRSKSAHAWFSTNTCER